MDFEQIYEWSEHPRMKKRIQKNQHDTKKHKTQKMFFLLCEPSEKLKQKNTMKRFKKKRLKKKRLKKNALF